MQRLDQLPILLPSVFELLRKFSPLVPSPHALPSHLSRRGFHPLPCQPTTGYILYILRLLHSQDLARNPALVGLDLCQSGIQGTGVASIAVALGANVLYIPRPNTTLTSLNLQCCEAFAAGAKHVASMMRSNLFLKILILNDNNIGAEGGTAIAEALKENQSAPSLTKAKFFN